VYKNEDEFNILSFQDDALTYKNMHDLFQAFILADKEDLSNKLQEVTDHWNINDIK
jgi:hypothetical protein